MKWIIFFASAILIIGCDANVQFKGTVLNKSTHNPIGGVAIMAIENPSERYSTLSAPNGQFEIAYISFSTSGEEYIIYKYGFMPIKQKLLTGKMNTIYLDSTTKLDSFYRDQWSHF